MHSTHTPTDGCCPAHDPQSISELIVANGVLRGRVLRIPSQALFLGGREVEIEHYGALYRLRQTALGKLILTK